MLPDMRGLSAKKDFTEQANIRGTRFRLQSGGWSDCELHRYVNVQLAELVFGNAGPGQRFQRSLGILGGLRHTRP